MSGEKIRVILSLKRLVYSCVTTQQNNKQTAKG